MCGIKRGGRVSAAPNFGTQSVFELRLAAGHSAAMEGVGSARVKLAV